MDKKGCKKESLRFVGLFFCSIVDEAVAAVADVQGGHGEEEKNNYREHDDEDSFVSFQRIDILFVYFILDFEDLDEIYGIHFFILDFFIEIFHFEAQGFDDMVYGIRIWVYGFAAEYFLYGAVRNAGAVRYFSVVQVCFFFEFFEFDVYHFTLHLNNDKTRYGKQYSGGFGQRENPVLV